jgi:hypothetical protein
MKPSFKHLALPALLLGLSAAASAAPVFVSGVSEASGWLDVNKTGMDDTRLCWAASSSNILAYTGWTGGTSLSSNSSIFNNFKYYWNDKDGAPWYGTEWWFDGINQMQGTAGWAQLDRFSHIGFYKGWYDSNAEFSPVTSEDTLYKFVHGDTALGNVGIALGIRWQVENSSGELVDDGGHSVTLWGVDADSDQIYVTDSDDGVSDLKAYKYEEDAGTLRLLGYKDKDGNVLKGYFENIFGLEMKGAEDPAPTLPQLPEPSSFALLGLGLAGLRLARRRRSA